ncbi:HxlR family transcriptional regulator [Lactobacillus sp.] [Lactiplantibacillus mudanjiangensis]|uniref:winged helix-turn-helix transcriptional regulator n=1 Tax=Lactiplantibacillus mudanjiangensis TaxID=1296538 RepID=UPI001015B014|nr:winged helix-turn-helix transcriptional regulator [Lactiplantibacillus mudanjiangensis]VDG33577.1 HxlR family transcriptional regulator [Lactobacillus sp.] [Lactiplantibacillus mudanjiangensis]
MRDLNIGTKVGLALLTDKWNALTICNLTTTPAGFMGLRQQVRGISTLKLLTVLAKLEQLDLVVSTPNYTYALTPAGEQFQQSLMMLEAWGDQVITAMQ